MECEPTERLLREAVAWPVPSSVLGPRDVGPSNSTTAPVGVPELLVTVIVKVTVWSKFDGSGDETTAVVVGTRLTICANAAEVLGSNVASPE